MLSTKEEKKEPDTTQMNGKEVNWAHSAAQLMFASFGPGEAWCELREGSKWSRKEMAAAQLLGEQLPLGGKPRQA